MKLLPLLSLTCLLLWLPSCSLQAQNREATEKITREFTIAGDASRATLALYNIFGSVTVQGYSGKTVVVEITKTIKAPSAELLAQGQKEAQPGFEQHADSVLLYVAGPKTRGRGAKTSRTASATTGKTTSGRATPTSSTTP
ncbi:hypothetical protein MUN84_03385 [Hymenobacter sp. 5516J-16]|uniref:hypothetical protein n=1 Tax=Hymenobacter sp. 5516J-16 TaxID=2932253 RepID=UPI001FD5CCDD|nr:hypothetical protein [Hymenobacter sp. 5516J-16]UOQ77725.1 hypothetical protein MUN84_03385 [Hymenobacter sp. 5516J-16]